MFHRLQPCCFPQELFDIIVDQLWDDFPALLACSSTCRRLRLRARAHLYRSVVLSDLNANESTVGRLRLFYADAAEPWIPWDYIKHLELIIYAERDDVWDAFIDSLRGPARSMAQLEDLVLKGDGEGKPTYWLPLVMALHEACSSITYLDMEHSCDWQHWQLAYIISGFPALKHLAMPAHIRPHSYPTEPSTLIDDSSASLSLRSISLSANGPRDLESAGVLARHLGNKTIGYILFVDSFFLPSLLVQPSSELAMIYNSVKAISVDAKLPDSQIELLLDVYPCLNFLCLTVRLDESYYTDAQRRPCTIGSAAIRTVQHLAVHPESALQYLAVALHFPVKQGLRAKSTFNARLLDLCNALCAPSGLLDLCDALCAPSARHVQLIVICVLDAGDALGYSEILEMEKSVKNHVSDCCVRLNSPKRWASIVTRGGETGGCDWGDMTGAPMQKLISACISGRFHI